MPLAFVGQLDLGALGQEAGFPEDFSDAGLLSIFADAREDQTGLMGKR